MRPRRAPLQRFAERMKQQTREGGATHRRLSTGLRITFRRIEGLCSLSLGRRAPTTPSDLEVTIVARAFGAPEDVEPSLRTALWRHPKTHAPVAFNVVDLRWREITEENLS